MSDLLSAVVSLANLAWQTCKAAKEQKAECLRIGERLMNLIVLSHEWMVILKKTNNTEGLPSRVVFQSLKEVLTRLVLTLQALTVPKKQWTARVKRFMQSRETLVEVLKADQDLNAILQDVHFHQGNALFNQSNEHFDKIQSRFDRIEAMLLNVSHQQQAQVSARKILEHLAGQRDPQTTGTQTFQDRIDEVLKELQTTPSLTDMETLSSATQSISVTHPFTDSNTSLLSSSQSGQSSSMDESIDSSLVFDVSELKCEL